MAKRLNPEYEAVIRKLRPNMTDQEMADYEQKLIAEEEANQNDLILPYNPAEDDSTEEEAAQAPQMTPEPEIQEPIPQQAPQQIAEQPAVNAENTPMSYYDRAMASLKRSKGYDEAMIPALEEQQRRQDMYDTWASISKIGSALSGAKEDVSAYEQLKKKAERPLQKLTLQQQLEEKGLAKETENLQLAQAITDKKEKSDPNSQISRFAVQSLVDLGMASLKNYPVSYAQLEKLYPQLMQGLYTQIAAKARVEASKLAVQNQIRKSEQEYMQFKEAQALKEKELQQRKEIAEVQAKLKEQQIGVDNQNKEELKKVREETRKFQKDVTLDNQATKKITAMNKDTDYDAYSKSGEADSELEALIARKKKGESVKIPEGAALFKYAKIAQGDSSVIRDSDLKNLAGGTNVVTYLERLGAKLRGEQFTIQDLEEMKKVVNEVRRFKAKKIYIRHIKPMQFWARKQQYDLENNISPEIITELKSYHDGALTPEEKLNMLQAEIEKNQSRIDELSKKKEE